MENPSKYMFDIYFLFFLSKTNFEFFSKQIINYRTHHDKILKIFIKNEKKKKKNNSVVNK